MSAKNIPSSLYEFILVFLRPYRWQFITLMLLTLFAGAVSSIDNMLLRHAINSLSASSSNGNFVAVAFMLIVMYGGWWALAGLQWRLYEYLYMQTFPSLESDIVASLFSYTERHSHKFFQENFSGTVANRVIEMGEHVCKVLTMVLEQFGRKFCTIFFTLITLWTVHPYVGLAFLGWITLLLGINFAAAGKVHEHSAEFARSKARIFGQVVDSLTNILNVKLFARQDYESTYLKYGLDDMIQKDHLFHMSMLRTRSLETIISSIYIAGVLAMTVRLHALGQVTVGDFAVIISLSMTVVDYIWGLTQELGEFEKAVGSSRSALKVLSVPHEMEDPVDCVPLIVTKGAIEFKDVNFHHTVKGKLFEHLSVAIPGGQKVGLVGFSGSGKTTFINLIVRLYDVLDGSILIDSQDITKVTQNSLREHISVIPQNPQLFHRSIIENIRYGKPKATDEEVFSAAKAAFADDFIRKNEGGYFAFAGERGLKLSGGQVQRIAIARAILKNAPILILDEATSALDSVTEHEIQQSFENLMQGKTTLVIAHRISTLLNMDRILVFDKGQLVGDGKHDDLLKQEGLYAKLWNSQVNGMLWHEEE